ncbi:MAG: radical SAM protein [Deltaproteobacteria bacterium]|nr:radical SAM protein [Deltaproteobacteria bacterium]
MTLYRPPSEARSLILQATTGCPWNRCTFCAMYRDRSFQILPLDALERALDRLTPAQVAGVTRVFVADGDALAMSPERWMALLEALRYRFRRLERVSSYASTRSILRWTPTALREVREAGLSLLYLGPESGDDQTLARLQKGSTASEHQEAAARCREGGPMLSTMFLLGAGGSDRSQEHAEATATLVTQMDPAFVSLLALTVVPGTPLAEEVRRGEFSPLSPRGMLRELRVIVDRANPTAAELRSNHASNYLVLKGSLPKDRQALLHRVDLALAGELPLRPEEHRGL